MWNIDFFNFEPNIEVRVYHPDFMPRQGTSQSAGFDLVNAKSESVTLHPGVTTKVPSGVHLNMMTSDQPIVALLTARSSMAKLGVTVAQGVGVIDQDYQGQVIIPLMNNSNDTVVIAPGCRIAQLVFMPVFKPMLQVVTDFTHDTERGEGGFGSTGQ